MSAPLPFPPRDRQLRLAPPDDRTSRRASGATGPDEALVDLEWLGDLLRFPFNALRRHRRLALTAASLVLLATALAVVIAPRTYEVQSRILARRNMVLPALGNPRRTVPTESDAPAALAVEAVLNRDNLSAIIDSTGLVAKIPTLISLPRRAFELARERVKGPRTDVEKHDMLVKLLEQRLYVAAVDGTEGTVTIGVRWREPATALAIVELAQQRFLDRRYDQEVELLNESIGILERYVQNANDAIASSMASLRDLPGVRIADLDARRFTGAAQTSARTRALNGEMARLQAQLASVRNGLGQQEAAYTQRVSAARGRLTELQSRLGSAHPEVASARTELALASELPPGLAELRTEERALVDQLAKLGASMPGSTDAAAELAMQRLNFERLMQQRVDSLEDPRLTYARSQLKIAITNYEDMLERLEAARIELETARAAFKYRYTVTNPPEFPKKAASPNVPLLVVGGLLLTVLAAIFVATSRDVLGGRVVESWQVRRQLGLPVLGEVRQS
jgi:uncharacterized protein involved in exopolysaccharide biosynthesis